LEDDKVDYVWGVLLVLSTLVCWFLNLVGMPGNWFAVGLCALYAHFGPAVDRMDVGWTTVIVLAVLALVGELVELLAAAVGAKQAGGSKRGAFLSLIGSIVGGIAGMFIGVPIPVIGPLLGALLFAGAGALAGAVLGEQWKGRPMDESLRVGNAAFWGRIFGTLGKTLVGAVMVAVILAAVLF
jgi:uncharacterized protein YqgC (DUF456 family)